MLLKTKNFELEILENEFVCMEDEAATNFCEWKYLDPHLREKFSRIRRELLEVMEAFVTSDDRQNFRKISEEYRKEQACACEKPE